jgi:hypothetical protein
MQEVHSVKRIWGLFIGICTSPLYIVFACLGDPKRGFTAWISGGIVVGVVMMFWGLRGRAWFWATVGFIVAYHVPIIALMPWPFGRLSYVQMLPIAFPDICLAYGIIRLVEKVMEKVQGANGTAA